SRIREQLQNLGDNFVWVEAGSRNVQGIRTGTGTTKTLTMRDARAIQQSVPLIKLVSPQVDARIQVIYGNTNWSTTYRGVSPEFLSIRRWKIDDRAPAAPAASHPAGWPRRFQSANSRRAAPGAGGDQPHVYHSSRRHRFDLADRGRNRNHEHHARHRDGTDARDRSAARDRRQTRRYPLAVSARSVSFDLHQRPGRRDRRIHRLDGVLACAW